MQTQLYQFSAYGMLFSYILELGIFDMCFFQKVTAKGFLHLQLPLPFPLAQINFLAAQIKRATATGQTINATGVSLLFLIPFGIRPGAKSLITKNILEASPGQKVQEPVPEPRPNGPFGRERTMGASSCFLRCISHCGTSI